MIRMGYNGKNILSYELGTPFPGKEIKKWIRYHLDNQCGTKTKIARAMREYLNLNDDQLYVLYKRNDRSAARYGTYGVMNYSRTHRAS